MILVTLGTQDKSFVRLLKALDRCIEKKIIREEVIVQAGVTQYESKNMKIFDFIPRDEFEELISQCNILITHGGVGSIVTALEKGKKVIAAPRMSKYKEHTNDHQLQIVEEFASRGYIIPLKSMDSLEKSLQKVKNFKPKKYQSNQSNFIKLVEGYIEGNEKRTMKEKIGALYQKYKEIILYLIFGVLTTVISLIVYYALVYTVLDPNNAIQLQVANVISWVAGILFAYITNRTIVFESKNTNRLKEATSFVGARLLTLFMDMAIMYFGVTMLKGNDKVLKLVSQVVVIVGNYIFSKLFVFKKERSDS